MSRVKRGLEFHRPSWTLMWWTSTGFWSIKLCRTLDGRFALDGQLFPLWGTRREDREETQPDGPGRTRTRTTRGWRAWCPYIMLWRMDNVRDHVRVEVPEGDPRIGTTLRVH